MNLAKKTDLLFLILAALKSKDRLCGKADPWLPLPQAVTGISDLCLPKHFYGAHNFLGCEVEWRSLWP